ncbi:MAG: hypothetical protein HC799_19715 [Limnothrix sp. RL_2_0]|nr:hypothetical protein [Limnothrix sp. RL_2_0]
MEEEKEKNFSYFYFPAYDQRLGKGFENYLVNDFQINYLDLNPRINIFVGANNSGKSRFLRALKKYTGKQDKLVTCFDFAEIFSLLAFYNFIYHVTTPSPNNLTDLRNHKLLSLITFLQKPLDIQDKSLDLNCEGISFYS